MQSQKIETAHRPRYCALALVTGAGAFPFDMLRYDNCRPWHERDSYALTGDHLTDRRSCVVVQEHVDTAPRWTLARWQSFGWTVVPISWEEGYSFQRDGELPARVIGERAIAERLKHLPV